MATRTSAPTDGVAPSAEARVGAWFGRWLPGIRFPIAVWVVWRLWQLGLTLLLGGNDLVVSLRDTAFYYDGERYLQITKQGYVLSQAQMPNTAFFPGVSWLAWPVWKLTSSEVWTGHVVATVTGIAAFIAVWGVSKAWKDEAIARRAVVLLALFPSSLFLWTFYSEGLFIALGAGAVWADRRGKRWVAALLFVGLSTTRSVAILVPAVVVLARILRERRVDRWSLTYAGAGILGTLPVLWMMNHYTGDPFSFFGVQKDWGRGLSLPTTTIADGFSNLWPDPKTIMVPALVARNFDLWCLLIVGVAIGYLAVSGPSGREGTGLLDRFPKESWMIGVALVALPLCSTSLASFNRFVMANWVIYPAYASILMRLPRWWRRAAWVAIVVALGITTYHMVGRFSVDRFIG